ncbi:MAG TPA: flagellar biosynthesis protein FlhF [Burkholderiaceae bacterium]|nr:flagellar biosynthesis protein FlhF [Burkholderiaceae bacterium]
MNIQRFQAATSREAMAKARAAFGDSAVILSSRATAGGFEVVATTEENLATLPVGGGGAASQPSNGVQSASERARAQAAALPARPQPERPASVVERDTETMAMSTLSFQDYVRERMLKRRKEALEGRPSLASPVRPETVVPQPAQQAAIGADERGVTLPRRSLAERVAMGDLPAQQRQAPFQAQQAPAPIVTREMGRDIGRELSREMGRPSAAQDVHRQAQADWASAMVVPQPDMGLSQAVPAADISGELSALKDMIEDRFNMLAWLGTSRNNPLQSNLMLKLIRAGYSPALVRSVLERLPADAAPADAVRWVMDVLTRNLKATESLTGICDEGGVVALIGATGVGKTTTAAKLAAQCVKQYGANSVGLITLDTYRVAGYEQLRAYGRMMGVVAHLAHDRAALKDLLNLLSGKRLVIIDTAGLGQKDPRIQDMLEVLEMPNVKKMLVLNASSHGDTLDDVLSSFQAKALHGVVLSKVDEAVKLGPALDALIRHQVMLRGVANGQRVPEDWVAPQAAQLVRQSMGTEGKSAYDPSPSEVGFFFAQQTPKHMNLGALRV